MKRKMITIFILLLAVFSLSACGGGTTSDEKNIVDKLVAAEYVLENYDNETHEYFAGQIKNIFDLTVTVNKLYQGYVYVDEDPTRFVRVVVLANNTQAENYFNELVAVKNETEFIYRSGTVVVYTYSELTYQLFTE